LRRKKADAEQTADAAPGRNNQMTLTSMAPGQSGFITSIKNQDETFYRLSELGLIEGQKVTFLKRAPLGDPIEIRIMNYELCLRGSEASQIEINLDESLHSSIR